MPTPAVQDQPFRLIQISDCHLPARPGQTLRGWDNWAALQAVLDDVRARQRQVDAFILTGDLVHDESVAGYRRLAALMREWQVPVFAIAGNHDDPVTMHRAMSGVQTRGEAAVGAWRLLLLNSHVGGSDEGEIGQPQLQRLDAALARQPHAPALLAVHHPPMPVASPWIDALGLKDASALLRMARAHTQVRAIISGHVHQASDQRRGRIRLLTTPAVTRQFLPRSLEPAEDCSRAPGYRRLSLHGDGQLQTRVFRVIQARRAGSQQAD